MRTFTRVAAALALGAAAVATAQTMGPRDVDALPSTKPALVSAYGDDPNQVGELRLPAGKGPFPVIEVVHGGCWTKGYGTRQNTAALASALTAMGYATWNVDYRQVGDAGGGWPGTFRDWAAATDHLRVLAKTQPLDLKRVSVVGHSAGAHAALWIASRPRLPRDSEVSSRDPLPIVTAVAIDGPGELAPFVGLDKAVCGKPVIAPLIGGTPQEQPARYRLATPLDALPVKSRQYLVASSVLTPAMAAGYREKAAAKGQAIEVLDVANGGHFDIIAPGAPAFETQVKPFLMKALGPAKR